MVLFEARGRRGGSGNPHVVPAGFEAVAEVLRDGQPGEEALRAAGRGTAELGVPLEVALEDLAATFRVVLGTQEPRFAAVREFAQGYSDAQIGYLHSLSCEDPLTALTSLSHLRTRIGDAFRAATRDGTDVDLTLVLVEVLDEPTAMSRLDAAMLLVPISEMMRSVFSGDETLARLSGTRAAGLVRRDDRLAAGTTSLRELLDDWTARGGPRTRVWIEGLPTTISTAVALLDDLSR
jgi:hypothetical protein